MGWLLILGAVLQGQVFEGLNKGDRIEVTFSGGRTLIGTVTQLAPDRSSLRLDASDDYPALAGTMKVEAGRVKAVRRLEPLDEATRRARVREARAELERDEAERRAKLTKLRERPFEGATTTARRGLFAVTTDGGAPLAHQVAADLEAAFADFERFFTGRRDTNVRYGVLVFSSAEAFRAYFELLFGPPANPNLFGFYHASERTLVFFFDGDYERMTIFMRHEAFHAFLAAFGVEAPAWFNEGMATYYETSLSGVPRANPPRAGQLKLLREQKLLLGLEAIRRLSYDEVLNGTLEVQPAGRIPRYYAQLWSWIQFLMSDPKRREILPRYLEALADGDEAAAWSAATRGLNADALEAEWRRFQER
jgi:hypothetical protein